MTKLVKGIKVRKEANPIDLEYKGKLSDDVFKKCTEFSIFYFSLPQGFDNLHEKRFELKDKAKELKTFITSSNKEVFLSYLEDLIVRGSHYEFLIPYRDICNESHHDINSDVSLHNDYHFGLLGTVDDILAAA